MDKETKFCTKCGEKINIDAEFCPKCGASQLKTDAKAHGASTYEEPANTQPVSASSAPAKPQKTGTFLLWGWITAVISLFIPILAIISVVLGAMTIKNKKIVAGVVLIVFAVIFFYLGMTGFSKGFFSSI
ncbi:zinc-ribbon domain-containing protein [Loigolactobacillus bifermentans]|jgi:uncharacterized membrane protein YvbJ|uniref:zinc-ribbon domain-containing protein n=1 Tax=Loigolactobacillus bifermentans TaxID=1607 RepID=UPI0009F85298|nr:zinc ribbon domain-containing protein [Loigolactobacillus bifermentans]QGG59604.1 zinc-ribbon domain-containing protein [Loigolactobacillus bifermentans]